MTGTHLTKVNLPKTAIYAKHKPPQTSSLGLIYAGQQLSRLKERALVSLKLPRQQKTLAVIKICYWRMSGLTYRRWEEIVFLAPHLPQGRTYICKIRI